MVGPRSVGEQRHQRRKTVTFDERCDVLEFSAEEEDVEEYYDDGVYSHGYSYDASRDPGPDDDQLQDHDDVQDHDESMEDSFDSNSQLVDDSITGMVDSMLEAARPHTPPRPEDEEDVQLLPPSPSPAKPPRPPRQASPALLREGSSSQSLRKSFLPRALPNLPLSAPSFPSLYPHVIRSDADHRI